ncbi:hypothetical protein [Schleiferilactobacillus perolens]|jgi:hypothetical protein|uniref:Uncharacterized protein n=1 Tax=Schleiferilactobacillus perolens DSM 12744 TaxID=1423792 RepID=A0A0R1N208_9LACO|nr:hypothetical protein [Schleiferilactobacillus perolens]KRL14303.1 hypothetical protein FD09_GL001472 [Schleiferilactobacillus perolens DSM 12744]MCI1891373.1 hypothetical protein [Schleiferilactobacillus harbinensis]MCI1912319.1 hypothetical protein [Schleiferilactobacillus harbinensis]MCI2170632.1 hypothetical protein [Schleiferilactobacillus perolens]
MIFVWVGGIILAIGVKYVFWPAKRADEIVAYKSYLASTNEAAFKYAQQQARNAHLIIGGGTLLLGLFIHWLHWDNFFIIWLFLSVLLTVGIFAYVETKLKKYLIDRDELPRDYVDPDNNLAHKRRHRTIGLRDRLK